MAKGSRPSSKGSPPEPLDCGPFGDENKRGLSFHLNVPVSGS